jgi:hypothetical protein
LLLRHQWPLAEPDRDGASASEPVVHADDRRLLPIVQAKGLAMSIHFTGSVGAVSKRDFRRRIRAFGRTRIRRRKDKISVRTALLP